MYLDNKVIISIEMYNHLYKIKQASKDKSMFLKGCAFDGTEYFYFTDAQKKLCGRLQQLEKQLELQKLLSKKVNQTFKQKLINLFK